MCGPNDIHVVLAQGGERAVVGSEFEGARSNPATEQVRWYVFDLHGGYENSGRDKFWEITQESGAVLLVAPRELAAAPPELLSSIDDKLSRSSSARNSMENGSSSDGHQFLPRSSHKNHVAVSHKKSRIDAPDDRNETILQPRRAVSSSKLHIWRLRQKNTLTRVGVTYYSGKARGGAARTGGARFSRASTGHVSPIIGEN